MNPDQQLEEYERVIREAQAQTDMAKLNLAQQEINVAENERGMVSEQLDLTDELERIGHLLRGHVIKRDDEGISHWEEPDNKDLIILSEAGVNYVEWAIQWYLTKNTLLSNYDDKQINEKMEDLSTTIADNLFMKYDTYFRYPTLDECKEELKSRIQKKVDLRMFALELANKDVNEKEIEKEIIEEMEDRIERELEVIREQKMKDRLKMFESLVRFIQDTIHSTYQRAWKGQERTTLRQHIHISETKGGITTPQQQGGFNPLAILSRKR